MGSLIGSAVGAGTATILAYKYLKPTEKEAEELQAKLKAAEDLTTTTLLERKKAKEIIAKAEELINSTCNVQQITDYKNTKEVISARYAKDKLKLIVPPATNLKPPPG